jgi:hypothetical protein
VRGRLSEVLLAGLEGGEQFLNGFVFLEEFVWVRFGHPASLVQ